MIRMSEINNPAAKELITQIENIAGKTEELSQICPHIKNSGASRQFKALILKLDTMSESDLATAHNTLIDIPIWEQLPQNLDEAIAKIKNASASLQAQPCQKAPSQKKISIIKSDIVAAQADCTLEPCSGPTQVQVDDLAIAAAALDAAVAVAQLAADIAAAIFEPAGKVLQIVASTLDVAAKALALAVAIQQRAADVRAECEDNELTDMLVSMCSTLNSVENKENMILDKITEIDKKLEQLLIAVGRVQDTIDEILLHQIEEALAECKLLVSLYLPDSLYGSISKVQTIVSRLISNSKYAGLTTANAQSYWRQGVVALENGEYEKALQWFMLAYKQLQTKDVCSVPCPSAPCGP
jgi:tetratricopeptide (TPR) repeat protein